jgi:hypothetical protein
LREVVHHFVDQRKGLSPIQELFTLQKESSSPNQKLQLLGASHFDKDFAKLSDALLHQLVVFLMDPDRMDHVVEGLDKLSSQFHQFCILS